MDHKAVDLPPPKEGGQQIRRAKVRGLTGKAEHQPAFESGHMTDGAFSLDINFRVSYPINSVGVL